MSAKPDHYLTLTGQYGPEEFKEKGSRFISYALPVASREDAIAEIARFRKEFYDATHVCFAFRLGKAEENYHRYSDDGEPGGTAGLPIYNEIVRSKYMNVLTAVVRYYGGTKLGTGGLARAYGKSARLVLTGTVPLIRKIRNRVRVVFPFALTGEVMQVVQHHSLEIASQDYSQQGGTLELLVPVTAVGEIRQAFTDRTAGRVTARDLGEEP